MGYLCHKRKHALAYGTGYVVRLTRRSAPKEEGPATCFSYNTCCTGIPGDKVPGQAECHNILPSRHCFHRVLLAAFSPEKRGGQCHGASASPSGIPASHSSFDLCRLPFLILSLFCTDLGTGIQYTQQENTRALSEQAHVRACHQECFGSATLWGLSGTTDRLFRLR